MRLRGLSSARAVWWAQRAGRQARRDLSAGSLDSLMVLPPPPLPQGCRRWAVTVLRLRHDTCLVRSAVLQAWDAAHGRPRDLLIGVTAPGAGFKAHAWLEGEPASASAGFAEFTRRPPPECPRVADGGDPPRSQGGGRQQSLDQAGKVGPVP
jgi:hypothetical protein